MIQEKLQQAAQAWNGLSAEQKQGIWNGFVEKMSNININDLPFSESKNIDGGGTDWRTTCELWVNDRIGAVVDFDGDGVKSVSK